MVIDTSLSNSRFDLGKSLALWAKEMAGISHQIDCLVGPIRWLDEWNVSEQIPIRHYQIHPHYRTHRPHNDAKLLPS